MLSRRDWKRVFSNNYSILYCRVFYTRYRISHILHTCASEASSAIRISLVDY